MNRSRYRHLLVRCLVLGLVALACVVVTSSLMRPGLGQEGAAIGVAGGSLLQAAPFDRITLTDGTVLDVDPVSPRPLPAYDPSKNRKTEKNPRPPREGNIFLPGEKPKGAAPEEQEA